MCLSGFKPTLVMLDEVGSSCCFGCGIRCGRFILWPFLMTFAFGFGRLFECDEDEQATDDPVIAGEIVALLRD